MGIVIARGTLILPEGPVRADLRVENGVIAAIGPDLPPDGCEVIDAAGKLVFPGFIDTHTHFEMNKDLPNETADDFESGTLAALMGGTTTILDFATQERGDTLSHALKIWHRRAGDHCSCHYGFHMAITDWNENTAEELAAMTTAGVSSYKLYMAYDVLRVDDGTAYEVVRAAAAQGGVVGMHCENGDLVAAGIAAQKAAGQLGPSAHPRSRPPAVEAEAVTRWLTIAELAGAPVNVVHLSSKRGLEAARAARARGQKLYLETCPQYLLLDERCFDTPDPAEGLKYIFSPPPRKKEDCEALWQALASGEIDTVGTDHCSFDFMGPKQLGRSDFSATPNGIPGVEHRPALLYTYGVAAGRITAADMARVLAENPAKLFGMYPKKGVLRVGSDADLVIFDPNYTGRITADTQYQRVDYTPYEGFAVCGRAETVLLDGAVAVRGGAPVLSGRGRYIHRGEAQFWR